jgi:hypothetical protein
MGAMRETEVGREIQTRVFNRPEIPGIKDNTL